jgi:hypothetical protein
MTAKTTVNVLMMRSLQSRSRAEAEKGRWAEIRWELRVFYDVGIVGSGNPSLRNARSGSGILSRVGNEVASMQS